MRKFKHVAIAGICCLAALAGGFWTQKDVATVSAEGTLTDLNTTENHFYMEPGAYVRVATNSSGIRFSTCVSDEWYQLATKDGATVEFHTVIDKYDNEDEGEEIDLTATHLTYDEKTKIHNFTGDIVYNDLTEAEKVLAYNMQLEAYSYAVIKKAGEADVKISSQPNGVSRSMAEAADIALKAEAANGYADSDEGNFNIETEGVLNNYRIIKQTTAYVEPTDGTLVMPKGFEDATILKVNMADENDTYDATAGTFAFDNDVATATAASNAYATVYTDKGIVETNFKVCTAVITDIADFKSAVTPDNPTGDITGYYYLANDIGSKTDYPSITPAWKVSGSTAFAGVFDGAGHEMNVTLGAATGLFRYLENATVQNVRFNIRANNSSQGYGLAQYVVGECYFTDMYLNLESVSNTCTQAAPLSRYYYGQSHFIRVVIETPTKEELSGFTDQSKFAALAVSYNYLNNDGKEKGDVQSWRIDTDVYVISSLPLATYGGLDAFKIEVKAHNQSTVISSTSTYFGQFEATNRGKLYAYESFANLKEDATAPDENTAAKIDLTKYTKTKYWTTDTNGYLTWKGNN